MALFSGSREEILDELKNMETRIIARINQLEKRIENIETRTAGISEILNEIVHLRNMTGAIEKTFHETRSRKNKKETERLNKRGMERDKKLFEFLKVPRNTTQIKNKFGYSRSYTSFLLNKYKKKGMIKVVKKDSNIPYFEVKNGV